MKNRILLTLLVSLATLVFSGCQREAFTPSGQAEDHFFLKSGNQHLPVLVAGNVSSKKFIVILHGGPGGNSIVYRDPYVKEEVEQDYAVVYWDQRFAGNSQGNSGDTDVSAFREDIKNLLLLLRSKYGADNRFYLFGHSWGGFLAPYFLTDDTNQSLVTGWIQIGGAHNYTMNDSLTREMLLHYGNIELTAGRNTTDWDEIVTWCNANGFEGRENAATLNGFAHRAETLIDEVTEGERTPPDLQQIQQNAILTQLINSLISATQGIDQPTYSIPNSDRLQTIRIPTLLLWGKYDFVCPPGLADDIEANIGSTDVTKIIYENSGHSPMFNQRAQFWTDVMAWVAIH